MRLKLYQSRKEENVKFKLKKEFDLSIEIYISFSWENQIFGLFEKLWSHFTDVLILLKG